MAFTRGLFYPWIDIENEAWLKTAGLYWDRIQTIVPEGMLQPYKATTAQAFYREGVLEPFIVASRLRDVKALTRAVLTYLETPEGLEVLTGGHGEYRYLHPDKLPQEVQEIIRIHPAKLPDYVRQRLKNGLREGDWIPVDRRFAAFYMTLLATRISEEHGLGLLTDTGAMDGLAGSAKLDANHRPVPQPTWHRMRYGGHDENPNVPPTLAEGLLASLVLEQLKIDPETPVRKIVEFRERHHDELGRFRAKVGELAASVSAEVPIRRLQQQVADVYANEVQPALSDLRHALTGRKIKFVAENVIKVSFFSVAGTSLPLAVLGMTVPVALLAGAGVSFTACAALYNVEKAAQLRESPYTYLLTAEHAFR